MLVSAGSHELISRNVQVGRAGVKVEHQLAVANGHRAEVRLVVLLWVSGNRTALRSSSSNDDLRGRDGTLACKLLVSSHHLLRAIPVNLAGGDLLDLKGAAAHQIGWSSESESGGRYQSGRDRERVHVEGLTI